MANATVRAFFGNGASVTWQTVDNADAGPPALKFDRSDAMNTAGNPVPIPTAAGTNFSWIKHVILDVTVLGTTNMLNRRVSQASAQPTGIALYWRAASVGAYVQASATAGNAEGNKPSDSGSNAAAPTPADLAAPATPTSSTATSGGTVLAGTYTYAVTRTTALNSATATGAVYDGESAASATNTQVTTGSTSTLTIVSPATATGATGWYAYVSQVNLTTLTRQQAAGSPTAIGTNLVLTAPPSSSGAALPTFDSSGYTVVTTSNVVYDNTTVSTGSTGTNGAMCILALGVDNTYTGGAGSAVALQNLQLTYDEQ